MKVFSFIFMSMSVFLSLNSWSQGTSSDDSNIYQGKSDEYSIDRHYAAGPYLIYSCERSHYACISLESAKKCILSRQLAIKAKQEKLPCAPLQNFINKEQCLLAHYKAVDSGALKRFCYLDNKLKK